MAADTLILQWRQYATRVAVGVARTCGADFDDAVGDGMVALIEAAHRYEPGRGVKFDSFLYPRVYGAVINGRQRWQEAMGDARVPRQYVELDDTHASTAESPEDALIRSEAAAEVRRALARCRPSRREAILLYYWGELTGQEIADRRGFAVKTVDAHLARGRAQMRDVLAA